MQKNPVRPEYSERCPHAEEVEDVDGMDVTVRADASDSEEVMKGSEGDGAESQEVQGEVMEASRTGQEEDAETQAPRAARAPHTRRVNARSTTTTWYTARTEHGARPACEARPKTIVT